MKVLGSMFRALFKSKTDDSMPTNEDYGKTSAYVFKEAIQFPPVTLGAAVGFLAGLFSTVFFSPILFVIASLSGLVALGGFLYKWQFKANDLVEEYFEDLDRRKARWREENILTVLRNCVEADFRDGARALKQILDRVQHMEDKHKSEADRQRVQTFLDQAQRALDAAVKIINGALATHTALRETPIDELRSEITSWEREVELLRKEEVNKAKIESNQLMIDRNRDLLRRIEASEASVQKALVTCTEIENALHATSLELPLLLTSGASASDSNIAKTLMSNVDAHVRAEVQLRTAEQGPDMDALKRKYHTKE